MTGPPCGGEYDPEQFWDAKAVRSGGDPARAACVDDPDANRCIDRVQRHLLSAAMRHVSKRIDPGGAVLLDYGCGSGRWVEFFASRWFRYGGVDISTEMLRIARSRHPGATFARILDGRVPFPEGSCDVACSIAVIHHNPYDRQDRMAFARMVRAGGYVILFEGIGARAPAGALLSPRPLADWVSLWTRLGFRLELYRGTRYGILRWVAERVTGARQGNAAKHAWQRLVDRLDIAFDPYLGPLLPAAYHRRALMVFRKASPAG